MSSCYILELSIGPGGMPRGDVFVYNRLEHIRSILEQELTPDERPDSWDGATFALAGGQQMLLWTIEKHIVTSVLDLRPFVRARRGELVITLEDEEPQTSLGLDGSFNVPADVSFEIDWPTIASRVAASLSDPVRTGQTIDVPGEDALFKQHDSYLGGVRTLPYGRSDLANEEEAEDSWVDPDPVLSEDDDE